MAHPYKNESKETGKSKMRAMGGKTPFNQHDADRRLSGATVGGVRAMSYPLNNHGQGSGEGRLDQAKAAKKR